MKIRFLLLICTLLLVACQPSAEAVEKAIAQTQTASPTETHTPTPTPIPLEEIDLSEMIFQEGDLPAGYSPAQIRSEGTAETKVIKETPINTFHQDLSYQGEEGEEYQYIYSTPKK